MCLSHKRCSLLENSYSTYLYRDLAEGSICEISSPKITSCLRSFVKVVEGFRLEFSSIEINA